MRHLYTIASPRLIFIYIRLISPRCKRGVSNNLRFSEAQGAPTHTHRHTGARRGAREAPSTYPHTEALRHTPTDTPRGTGRAGSAIYTSTRRGVQRRAGSAPFVRSPTLAAWGKRRTSLSHPALQRCAICTQSPLRGSFSYIYASSPHAASAGFPTICASPKRETRRHTPTDTHRGARGAGSAIHTPTNRDAPTHPQTRRGARSAREATPTHTSTRRGVQRRAGSAPFVRSPTLAAWGKRRTSLSHPALRRCAEGGGKTKK